MAILVVEDEHHDFLNVRRNLEKMRRYQADVRLARTVEEARREASRAKFDIAIVDFRLGNDSGARILRDLHERFPYMALVLVSGLSSSEVKDAALRSGAMFCLEKESLTPIILETTIQCALHSAKVQEKLAQSLAEMSTALASRVAILTRLQGLRRAGKGSGIKRARGEFRSELVFDTPYGGKLETIHDHAMRAVEALDEAAEATALVSYREEVECVDWDLNDLVRSALDALHVARLAQRYDLVLALENFPLVVRGKEVSLTQAIISLLSAMAANVPAGGKLIVGTVATSPGVELRLSRGEDRESGVRARPGAAPLLAGFDGRFASDGLEHSYERAGEAGEGQYFKPAYETSLGIAGEIAALHGGRVTCERGPGGLSSIVLTLPTTPRIAR